MNVTIRQALWHQFGAAIDTLKKSTQLCPEQLWYDQETSHPFWYVTSHTLFWLDYYLTADPDSYRPPEPFGLEELDPAGVIPDPPYSKEQLLDYLEYSRERCREIVLNLTEEQAGRPFKFPSFDMPYVELLLYNLRHVQHHSAQLILILRQRIDATPGWVSRAGR